MGALFLTQHLVQRDVYFVNKFFLGMDYRDFYLGGALLIGNTPHLPDHRRIEMWR